MGATVGGGYTMYQNVGNKKTKPEELKPEIIDEMPNVRVMRKIVNENDKTGLDLELVLFQFQTCPFCCKVRAFLDCAGFSYSVVEVDAVLRQDIKWSKSKKVPTLLAKTKDGKYVQLNDSSMIISALSTYLLDPKADMKDVADFYPVTKFSDVYGKLFDIANKYFVMYQQVQPKQTKEEMAEERKWRNWADNHLVHLISPNVYRNYSEATETFEWFSEAGQWKTYFPSWEERLMVHVGTFAMYLIAKRLTKRHELGDDVREHIYMACDKWMEAVKKNKSPFLGGKTPNLADLSVYGVLCSMEGCKAFKDCLENTEIGEWFYKVKEVVDQNRGTKKNIGIY